MRKRLTQPRVGNGRALARDANDAGAHVTVRQRASITKAQLTTAVNVEVRPRRQPLLRPLAASGRGPEMARVTLGPAFLHMLGVDVASVRKRAEGAVEHDVHLATPSVRRVGDVDVGCIRTETRQRIRNTLGSPTPDRLRSTRGDDAWRIEEQTDPLVEVGMEPKAFMKAPTYARSRSRRSTEGASHESPDRRTEGHDEPLSAQDRSIKLPQVPPSLPRRQRKHAQRQDVRGERGVRRPVRTV